MLRYILSPGLFLELEGARRWVPRNQQPYDNISKPNRPPIGPDGGLSIQGGSGESGKNGKGEEGRSKPNPVGLSNPKGGNGIGGKGDR